MIVSQNFSPSLLLSKLVWAKYPEDIKNYTTTEMKYCDSKTANQKDHKLVFKTIYRLMQLKSIAESSKGSILQYFRPSLGYH